MEVEANEYVVYMFFYRCNLDAHNPHSHHMTHACAFVYTQKRDGEALQPPGRGKSAVPSNVHVCTLNFMEKFLFLQTKETKLKKTSMTRGASSHRPSSIFVVMVGRRRGQLTSHHQFLRPIIMGFLEKTTINLVTYKKPSECGCNHPIKLYLYKNQWNESWWPVTISAHYYTTTDFSRSLLGFE